MDKYMNFPVIYITRCSSFAAYYP